MTAPQSKPSEFLLPVLLLKNYLHFLSRRPISGSNLHFKAGRISSLQSLAPLLDTCDEQEMQTASRMLRTLTPESLTRIAPEILRILHTWREPGLPRDLLVAETSPDAVFFAETRSVVMVLGQGIGIGDEILTFPLAAALRSRLPADATLTVLSSYRDLWKDVAGVTHQAMYGGLSEVVHAVRHGGYDLVAMVDFERPGLVSAMHAELSVKRYIEMAMGIRHLSAVDNRRGVAWEMPAPRSYWTNLYHNMDRVQEWLGATPSTKPVWERRAPKSVTTVYLSPFTSKEDPSERYWSELIRQTFPHTMAEGRRVDLWIDSGANYATRAFATSLANSVKDLHELGIHCEPVASMSLGGSLLSLSDAMGRIAKTDIVITADSFPAHAGQLYGKLTFVLARDGVENWRAPVPGSFYLRAGEPLETIASQLHAMLRDLSGISGEADITPQEWFTTLAPFAEARKHLAVALENGSTQGDLMERWAVCRHEVAQLIRNSGRWPPGYGLLLIDHEYARLMPPLPDVDLGTVQGKLHLQSRWAECENSNLFKYAHWLTAEAM